MRGAAFWEHFCGGVNKTRGTPGYKEQRRPKSRKSLNFLAQESGQVVKLFTGQCGRMRTLRRKLMSWCAHTEFEALAVYVGVVVSKTLQELRPQKRGGS